VVLKRKFRLPLVLKGKLRLPFLPSAFG
jgi:hypothetical protein